MGGAEYVGFVYIIHDLPENKMYIGKKDYFVKRGAQKGAPSKWRDYVSSNKDLAATVEKYGKESFDFYVLGEYKTASGLIYAETWSLCSVDAPCKTNWINKRVEEVSWFIKEPVTDAHKAELIRLNALLEG
jgi:hypothetical protein